MKMKIKEYVKGLEDEFILFEKLKRDWREYCSLQNHLVLSLALTFDIDSDEVGDLVTTYLDDDENVFEDLINKLKPLKKRK